MKHSVHKTDGKIVVKSVVVGVDIVRMGSISILVESVTVKHTVYTIDGKIIVKSVVVGMGCAKPLSVRHVEAGITKDTAYVALSICKFVHG